MLDAERSGGLDGSSPEEGVSLRGGQVGPDAEPEPPVADASTRAPITANETKARRKYLRESANSTGAPMFSEEWLKRRRLLGSNPAADDPPEPPPASSSAPEGMEQKRRRTSGAPESTEMEQWSGLETETSACLDRTEPSCIYT